MIGNILLTLGLVSGVFTVLMYYLTYRGYENTLPIARISYHFTAIMVICSAALLLYAILTHQYQYKYVYNYSGSDLPTGLLMSTFYAGQEGSFMLWTFLTSIIGLILLEYTSKRGDLEPRVMMIFSLSLSCLLVMVSPLLKSPFNYIWMEKDFIDLKNINNAYLTLPALQSFIFTDPQSNKQFVEMGKDLYAALVSNNISVNNFIIQGKGLNPLLQNFWMQIHPPILFTGFSMSAVPFAFAMSAILKNEYRDWIKQALPWILTGTCILGFAIMLGGYWAYGVLGWGGYWGWDPVENSSLVPWLVGVASIHTILVQKKAQNNDGGSRFVKMNLILCIMTYVLVLYSTFLTRSGILGDASVHSFVDPGMAVYLFLIIFLVLFTLLGIGGIVYRWKYLSEHFTFEENVLSRELALFTGSVALIATAIIVWVGTSTPIFGQSVQPSFYNELNLPIAIIIGLLNGLSILLKWKVTDKEQLWKQSQFSVASAIVLTILAVVFGGVYNIMLVLLTFSSAFALFVNGEIAYKILRGRKSHLGPYIAHIGIALFLIGVLATAGHSKQRQVDLIKGEKVSVLGHDLTFIGWEPFDNGKKYHFNIEIKDGNSTKIVSPVMFVAEFNNSMMREPDIWVGFLKDFYIEPKGYSDGSESREGSTISFKKGETQNINGADITFNEFDFPPEVRDAMIAGKDFKVGAKFSVKFNGKTEDVETVMQSIGGNREFIPVELKEANIKMIMGNLNAAGSVELKVSSLDGSAGNIPSKEVLSIEASVKPFISLVWIGVLTMAAGFLISAFRRSKESPLQISTPVVK
jgi:cytochrome c-type biogenesis protein CcmF